MNSRIIIFIILTFFANYLSRSTYACTCASPDPPEIEYHYFDAIFTGRVVGISLISRYGWIYRLVKFEVDKKWKGVHSMEVGVITASSSAACGYDFILDTIYLVYAQLNDDTLETGLCTRTNPVWRAEEDIAFLNSLSIHNNLEPFGLRDREITSLAIEESDYYKTYPISNYIFAGIAEGGVFEISATVESPEWVSIGLEDKPITALTVQHWGAGPFDGLILCAAVTADYQQGDSMLIFRKSFVLDTNWIEFDNGIDKSFNHINALNSYYYSGHEPPQPILAGSNNGLYYFLDNFWSQSEIKDVNLQPVIFSIDVSPHWRGNISWAVGHVGVAPDIAPVAIHSTDQGITWNLLTLPENRISATDVVINTRSPDSVYICLNTKIILSPDNGVTWEYVFSSRGVYINALAIDPLQPENIFAGGWFFDDSNQSPNHGVFLHSTNAGNDWNEIFPIEDTLDIITSIVVFGKPNEDYTSVFIGTKGMGVWRYKYPVITDVTENKNIPEQFVLYQNYPNPFNPTTQIKYSIPESGNISLKIYNLLGQEVANLFEGYQPADSYNFSFNGKDLASGVYFYRLRAIDFVETKKLILLK